MVRKKKSISFVCERLCNGGAERVLSILIRNYAKTGWKVQVILLKEPQIDYELPEDVQIIFLDFKPNRTVSEYISRIKKLRNAITGDVVISFLYSAIRDTAVSILGKDKVLIVSERNDPSSYPEDIVNRTIRTISYYFANAVVFQTTYAKNYFPRSLQKRGVVISNPVKKDLPDYDIENADNIVIAAGRLVPQKNFSMLIRAFAKLHRNFPEYTLAIYGDGYLEDDLKKLAEELNIRQNVKFSGFIKNIHEKMSHSKIYVSSSNWEGISNSMLEAMAIGVPSVCTDCPAGGAKETIINGNNGLLVPINDEEKFYQAMYKILADKEYAKKLSENAKNIRESHSEEKIFKKWLELTERYIS